MRTKLFVLLMLVSILLGSCAGQATAPAPEEPKAPPAAEAPAPTTPPAAEAPAPPTAQASAEERVLEVWTMSSRRCRKR